MWIVILGVLATENAGAQDMQFPDVTIAGSVAECVSIARTGDLLVYRYQVRNARLSDTGVKSFILDVSEPLGLHPAMLETHGLFVGDGTVNTATPTAGHAPVGLDIPDGWRAGIFPDGRLRWWGPGEGLKALDPILPGRVRADFVVRSSYLPASRRYVLIPDYPYACCPYPAGDPRNIELDSKSDEDFRVEGMTVGPAVTPEEVESSGLTLIRIQLAQACDELGWIDNRGICNSLEQKLDNAAHSLDRGQDGAARGQLGTLLNELDAQRGNHVSENAYWLLKTNVEFILSLIP